MIHIGSTEISALHGYANSHNNVNVSIKCEYYFPTAVWRHSCFAATVRHSASVRACGRAGVRACGRAGVRACGRAGVRACGRAGVRACGRAYVRACMRACVRACVRVWRSCSSDHDQTVNRIEAKQKMKCLRSALEELPYVTVYIYVLRINTRCKSLCRNIM